MKILKKIRYKSKHWGKIKLIQLVGIRFLQKIIYWEWLLFYKKDLAERTDTKNSSIAINFRKAESIDIKAIDPTHFPMNENTFNDLKTGCECIIGTFQQQIVYFAWINYQQIVERTVMDYALLPHQAYIYRVFTLPAFRGYSIATTGYRFLFDYLRKREFTECIVAVNLENRPSIHSIVKSGFQKFGQLIYYKTGKKTKIVYTNLSKIFR
jgi:GNAT superfamily N-acetyltransferase